MLHPPLQQIHLYTFQGGIRFACQQKKEVREGIHSILICSEYVRPCRNEPAHDNFRAIFFGACQGNDIEIGSPLLEFTMPVLKSRLGYNDQMRAGNIPIVFKIGKEWYGLKSFSEALNHMSDGQISRGMNTEWNGWNFTIPSGWMLAVGCWLMFETVKPLSSVVIGTS